MPNLQQSDEFFSTHLLKEQYFTFSDEQRRAAVAAATRDITATLQLEHFPELPGELLLASVFEQAIYLLLNPHINAGSTDAKKQDIISPRAMTLLHRETEPEIARILTLKRG